MDLQDKHFFRVLASFRHAAAGVVYAFKTERNMKIHVFAAVLVLLFAYFFSVSRIEWLILLVAICLTMTLELVNTAIEHAVNLYTMEYHPHAKMAKDIAAGAVLISSAISAIIGFAIFIPRLIELFAG